jgi:WD40 repeat protein
MAKVPRPRVLEMPDHDSPPDTPMNSPIDEPGERSLERLLARVIESLERGNPVDPEHLAADYPEFAAELRSFFHNRAVLEGLADRLPLGETTSGMVARAELESPLESPLDETLRYFGDYELLEEIGRGGMGVVYRARQISLNRLVALKMILTGPRASQHEIQRLRNEAEAVAQLDHPQIVPLFETGSHAGHTYFSMKLIEGSNLAKQATRFVGSPRESAQLMTQVAHAVDHAHQHGILHRDLKPANILLDSEGSPHLTDFGLAKQVQLDHSLTQSGTLLGTPLYMAPEQARGEKNLSTATDIYSLGAMLYELLTGRPPLQADSSIELLRQVAEQEPVPAHHLRREVPRDLSWICQRCLEKSPDRRYRSARELAEDLERYLRHEPILAHPAGLSRRAMKWVRRHPTLTILLLTALLGVGGILWQWQAAVRANERYLVQLDQRRRDLAERELRGNDVLRARRLLRETPVDRRDWTWNYLFRLTHHTPHNRLPELESLITALTCSPDGRQIASSQWNGKLHLWSLAGGGRQLLAELETPPHQLAFSPDGARLLALHERGWGMWDVETSRLVHDQTLEDPATAGKPVDLAWHPSGKWYYVSLRGSTPDQDFEEREEEESAEESAEKESTEEQDLIAGYDSVTGERLWVVQRAPDPYHRRMARLAGSAKAVAWSPDGDLRLHMSHDGERLYLLGSRHFFNPETGELLGRLELPNDPDERHSTERALLLGLADRERVALLAPPDAIDNTLLIVQHVGRQERVTFAVPNNRWYYFGLSPDGRHLAVAIWGPNWDEDDVQLQQSLPFLGPLIHQHEKPRSWVSTVYLYETTEGTLRRSLRGFPSIATHLVFRPDGRQLFVGGGQTAGHSVAWTDNPKDMGFLTVWNTLAPETSRVLEGHRDAIRHVSVDSSETWLASSSRDGSVRIWDLDTGQPVSDSPIFQDPMGGEWVGADFAPRHPRLALCGGEQIQLLDVRTWEVERQWELTDLSPGERVHAVALCDDPQRLACLTTQDARVYDLSGPKLLLQIPASSAHSSAMNPRDRSIPTSMAISPDGKFLAVTYQFDQHGELRLHDVETRKELWRRETEHRLSAFRTGWGLVRVRFSSDGKRVAAVGNSGVILVCDARRGRLLWELDTEGIAIWGVAFSPDGTRLLTGGRDHTIRIWDLERGESVFTLRGHRTGVDALGFSPGGHRLISGSRDGQLRIWEAD